MSRDHAPILLAQHTTFLNVCLLGNANLMGISTLAVTFVALFGGLLNTFLGDISLVLEFATTFSTFSRMPSSFLMLWGS